MSDPTTADVLAATVAQTAAINAQTAALNAAREASQAAAKVMADAIAAMPANGMTESFVLELLRLVLDKPAPERQV